MPVRRGLDDIGFWEGIARDLSGKGQFRLFLQPVMAILLAVRVGLWDAKRGVRPFGVRLLESRRQRWRLLVRSVRHAWMPLSLALVMDGFFQYVTLGRIRILAAVVVGILLVWVPFTVARGVTNRIWNSAHSGRHNVDRARRRTRDGLPASFGHPSRPTPPATSRWFPGSQPCRRRGHRRGAPRGALVRIRGCCTLSRT
jgi:hypothetical protein